MPPTLSYACTNGTCSTPWGSGTKWYEHFEPTTDEDVIERLEEANRTVTTDDLREPG